MFLNAVCDCHQILRPGLCKLASYEKSSSTYSTYAHDVSAHVSIIVSINAASVSFCISLSLSLSLSHTHTHTHIHVHIVLSAATVLRGRVLILIYIS